MKNDLIERLERDKQLIAGLQLKRIADDIEEVIELLKKEETDE